jgi:holo-[acyl-carrier protein] synthase
MYNYCMILGHGIDIVSLKRFYDMPLHRMNRLANRILTDSELDTYTDLAFQKQQVYLAKIWSSKEAIAKAFGTGIRGDITWKTIQISNNNLGKPLVQLNQKGVLCYLSISHEKEYLIASVILSV